MATLAQRCERSNQKIGCEEEVLAREEQNPTWLDPTAQRSAQGDSSAAFGFRMTRFAHSRPRLHAQRFGLARNASTLIKLFDPVHRIFRIRSFSEST
jgi:hypothetical protein